jgi:hypothetical protein
LLPVVALVLAVGGCCELPRLARLPRVGGAPASPARVAEVIHALRTAQSSIHTLRVAHHIALAKGGVSSGSLRGLLAVRRPDAYRLRVLGPAGLTAMDLVWSAGRFVLDVPAREVHLAGDARTPRRALHGVPIDGLARAFLGTYDATHAGLVEDRRWSVLTLEESPAVRRVLYLSPPEMTVVVDARFEGGRETLRLTHGDLRPVGGTLLAHDIRCDMPREGLVATIRVERYDVNPTLPDAAFRL